jgi:hypothetical protein
MAIRMQQRTGTYIQWNTSNPVLNGAEIGYESDTNKFKIGDGSTNWNDLPYFLDEVTLETSLDGYIPSSLLGANNGVAQLNSSGKLVSTQIPNVDEITQDAINTALVAGTGLDKTYDDNANTITLDIDSTVATKTYADGVAGTAQAAAELTASGALSTHSSVTTSVHGIADTAELATKTFAAELLTNATKTNIAITGDKNGLTITAENGVADSTTSDLAEGTSLYFTDERAQDAVGNAVGTGLSYNDSTGAISVDTTAIQAKVSGVTDTEIGYLDGVTSAIQTQINDKAPLASPTFTGTVAGITSTMVGLGNVDNTSDSAKPVSTATQTALDLKANLAGPTFTGTTTTDDLVVDGDFTVNGTNFAASATSITIEDNMVQLAHQNAANTVDLGVVVGYNDGTAKHAGIVRDVSDDKWKLFKGVTTEPTTTVNFGQGSLDNLQVAGLEATSATIGDVSNTELQYLNGVTSAIQTQIDTKAPIESPTFTGTVSGVTKSHVGLGNVDNTSDANKPVSTATQTALDAKIAKADISAKGAILVGTGSGTYVAQTVGTNGQVLTANSAQADGVEWTTISGYSAPTLGSTSIASGATVTNVNGLTVNSTTIPSSKTLVDTDSTQTLTGKTPAAGTTSTAAGGIGYMGLPQNGTTTGSYTITAADAGKHIYSTANRTITINSNANLALPVGTAIMFISGSGATTTIAITSDILYLGGVGSTGSRTLAPFGFATAVKITSTSWIISGNGLS